MYEKPEEFGFKCLTTDWSKTMHLFGRYEDEAPTLTFEYDEHTPWGRSMSKEKNSRQLFRIAKAAEGMRSCQQIDAVTQLGSTTSREGWSRFA